MAIQPYQEDDTVPANPLDSQGAKRLRWATKRMTGAEGLKKRQSIFRRLSKRGGPSQEKNRLSGGTDVESAPGGAIGEQDGEEQGAGRKVFFNLPLPADMRDEEGHPTAQYVRNKIRTAKYTPISFIPKNLYFQFHNVANIYFFFIIILGVCSVRGHALLLHSDPLSLHRV